MKQLPALPDLLAGITRALEHHVELESRGRRPALLRMAGREFRISGIEEPPPVVARQICQSLAEVAAYGVASVLADDSATGTRLRMDLIAALAHLETTKGPAREKHAEDGELLLTTAEAAAQLGMSRPYVSMLCNQGKLGEVRRSEGGHRRIRQSAVEAYKRTRNQAPH